MTEQDKLDIVNKMIDALNYTVRKHGIALEILVEHRVPVGNDIVDDPAMIPNEEPDGSFTLGLLGVLNGCLNAAGLPRIASRWRDDGLLLEFCLYKGQY